MPGCDNSHQVRFDFDIQIIPHCSLGGENVKFPYKRNKLLPIIRQILTKLHSVLLSKYKMWKFIWSCGFLFVGACFVEAVMIPEAEQMALEISGVMLPPKKLVRTIEEQLRAVRKFYPEMEAIRHRPKFMPGELLLTSVDELAVERINASRYGPVKKVFKVGDSEGKSVFHLVFGKPYHPSRLVERVRSEVGVREVEGNYLQGDGNDIQYHATALTYSTYTFVKAWGTCEEVCENKHYWAFTTAPSGETVTVKLEKEYGADLE